MKWLALTCFLGLLLWGSQLVAGETPRVIHIDPEESSQNWMITQSASGAMFFAQTEGLKQFDGQQWALHSLPHKQIVRAAEADNEGRVYVGGYAEFGFWQAAKGQPLRYTSLSSQLPPDRPLEEIWHILLLKDRKGVIFQSFSTIYYFDLRQIHVIDPPDNIMFLQQVGRRIIAPVIGKGLYEWDIQRGFSLLDGTEQLPAPRVKGLLPARNGGIIIATEQQGLWSYHDGQLQPWRNDAEAIFKNCQINRVARLRNGLYAFGTILCGLVVLDAEGKMQFQLEQRNGLQNNTVLALYEDRQGDLWVGLDQGVDLIAFSSPLRYYTDKYGQLGTLYTAALHNRTELYVGTNQGLFRSRRTEGVPPSFQLISGTQGQVWELSSHSSGLFIGHNEGAFALENNQLRQVSTVTGGWQMLPVPRRPGWAIQSTYTGLVVLRQDAQGRWQFSHRLEGLLAPLRQMAFDTEGHLWVVHASRGLWRLELSEDLRQIRNQIAWTQESGLPDTYAMSLTRLKDKLLFRSTAGYYEYSPGRAQFSRVDNYKSQPLPPSCFVLAGQRDDWFIVQPNEVRWMRGATKVADLAIQLVSSFPTIQYMEDGHYLFCLRNGYAIIPANYSEEGRRFVAEPTINQLIAHGRKLDSTLYSPPLQGLVLPAELNSLSFQFSQAWFSTPVRFRYRLAGFQDNWSDWTPVSHKEFTNLPHGRYTLQLQSDQQAATVSMAFTIKPHWWETTTARAAYTLMLIAVLSLFYRLHKRRLQIQARRMLIERERSIQQERIKTQNAQLEADVLRKSQELANSTFRLVRKNDILVQIREELESLKTEMANRMSERHYQRLRRLIDSHMTSEQDWKIFESNFNELHNVFFKHLKQDYPSLSPGDLRLAAYLKMNLSSKEIAPLLNISVRGVENKRYRLRQKMGLDAEVNLTEWLMRY